ncbi:MAG TPA: YdeI/OmpD-associated family protein, partial [Vicinamibacterales bacterium]|nr:YdeI/OmpD-associated family protein [Vicinamibacterales bacterium]
ERRGSKRLKAARAGGAAAKLTTFRTQAAFRAWLAAHHTTARELLLRVFRNHAAGTGVTYGQALDEALCFGWIDGVRRSVDDDSFSIRFTPRKPRSIWSRVNVGRVERLLKEGRMMPAGIAAFEARDETRTGIYSFENRPKSLPPETLDAFRANAVAWAFFAEQPPYYRRTMTYWILSAKKEETRARRLASLIDCCARRTIAPQMKRSKD